MYITNIIHKTMNAFPILKKSLSMNTRLSGTYNLQEKLVYTNNLCLQELF